MKKLTAPPESQESQPRSYHEMTLEEYATTPHSQRIPRWSILAVPSETYSLDQLCKFGVDALRALAFLWRVRQDGPKGELADRIVGRAQFRATLAVETMDSLAKRPREKLVQLAKEAGIYHPWLNRTALAAALIEWREQSRRHAAMEVAKARHEQIVRTAARKRLIVPTENLRRYGLGADGQREATILRVPVSRVVERTPGAIDAARRLSLNEFLGWVAANERVTSALVLLAPGALADGGALFWQQVQDAFTPPKSLPLFARLAGPEQDS